MCFLRAGFGKKVRILQEYGKWLLFSSACQNYKRFSPDVQCEKMVSLLEVKSQTCGGFQRLETTPWSSIPKLIHTKPPVLNYSLGFPTLVLAPVVVSALLFHSSDLFSLSLCLHVCLILGVVMCPVTSFLRWI